MVRSGFLIACLFAAALRSQASEPGDWSPPAKHRQTLQTVSWSPDGRTIASSSDDRRLALWDAETGRNLRPLTGPSVSGTLRLSWSADGKRLLTISGAMQRASVWEAATGKPYRTLLTPRLDILSGCLGPDGTRAYFGTFRGKILTWDAATGELLAPLEGHTKPVVSVAVSGDGASLISGSEDGTTVIWELAAGKPRHTLKVSKDRLEQVAVSRDGKTAVTAGRDRTAIVWDAATGEKPATLTDFETWVKSVSVTDDGSAVLASDSVKHNLWERATGKARLLDLGGNVPASELSRDGARVAYADGMDVRV